MNELAGERGYDGTNGGLGGRMDGVEAATTLLVRGEWALHLDGNLTSARDWFDRAYAEAEEAGDASVMASAALGLGGLWVHEHRTAAQAARVEARQRAALARTDPRSPTALRLRARLAAEADYRTDNSTSIVE